MDKSVKYFLGANTPYGFYGFYDHIANISEIEKMYILKGGPGTGKSEFMKRIAKKFQSENCDIEVIPCSSDPESLDGIIIKNKKIVIIDGTAPHCLDPKLPGAVEEIINFGQFWNGSFLKSNKKQIILLNDKITYCFSRAYRYLLAAQQLKLDSLEVISPYINRSRLKKLSDRLIKTEKLNKISEGGKIVPRFLSGLTPDGKVNFFENLISSNYSVYRLCDDYAVGKYLLDRIAQAAKEAGYLVYACYCPLFPQNTMEHVIIPEIKLAFVTSNEHHAYQYDYKRSVNLNRYIDKIALTSFRSRLRLNKKLYCKLLDNAIESIRESKDFHDILELIYIKSMDFKKVDKFIEDFYLSIR